MATLVRKRLRCEIYPSDCPEKKFVALRTGSAPKAAKAGGLEWELALFNDDATLFDISNIASLTVQITNSAGVVSATKTITRASGRLNAGLTLEQWQAGTHQHALVIFSGADMNFAAGSYIVSVYGFTDDDVGDNDPFGIADFALVEMFLNAGAAAAQAGKTVVYAEDLQGILAGVIRVDNPDGVTITLRKGAHSRTLGIDDSGVPIEDLN